MKIQIIFGSLQILLPKMISGMVILVSVVLKLNFIAGVVYLLLYISSVIVTEKENYNSIVEFAEKYLSSSEIALLTLGLSLRIYSARVEMFTQMAENKNISKFGCYNVVDIGGKFTCSVEDLGKLVNQVRIV